MTRRLPPTDTPPEVEFGGISEAQASEAKRVLSERDRLFGGPSAAAGGIVPPESDALAAELRAEAAQRGIRPTRAALLNAAASEIERLRACLVTADVALARIASQGKCSASKFTCLNGPVAISDRCQTCIAVVARG